MSIENITAKILSEANEYVSGLTSDANNEASGIVAKAKAEAEAAAAKTIEEAKNYAEVLIQRKQSVANLEARKMNLDAKQTAIAKALELASDKLANMDEADYIGFLAKSIAATGIKEGKLALSAKDKAGIGAKLVEAANQAIGDGKLELADEAINAKGGYVLKYGAMEINSTIETMINAVKEAVTPELVAALF